MHLDLGAPRPARGLDQPAVARAALLSREDVRAAVVQAAEKGQSTLAQLAEMSGLGGEELAEALGALFRYPVVDGPGLMALTPAFDHLGPADSQKRGCVVARRGSELVAVIADPFDSTVRSWVELRVPSSLTWYIAAPGDITAFLAKHEQGVSAMDAASAANEGVAITDSDVENLSLATIHADSSPVVKLVHSTVYDIHIEPFADAVRVRYRVDGVLVQVATLGGTELCEQVISRIKVMSELDIAERRTPQDGRFKLALNGILAQRLVRVICEQCAMPDQADKALLAESGINVAEVGQWRFRVGRGCAHCRGTGYKGRKAIGELLVLNDDLREAIVSRAPARRLKELAMDAGSRLIRTAALDLVKTGATTLLEANRVTALA